MALKSKELVKEKKVYFPSLALNLVSLLTETVGSVKSFYDSDDISRTMPGKKDYVSVKVDERRVPVQKND